jgi:V8-like Glu-specific endopeptidase
MRSPREFSQAIISSIDKDDKAETSLLCDELIASLFQSKDDFSSLEAEKIMAKLRSGMFFSLMQKVGNAFVMTGRGNFTIHRQFAQAAIEQKQIDLAVFILNDLVQRTSLSNDKKAIEENGEAKGLLGRAYKQLYVNASASSAESGHEYLKKSIDFYYAAYKTDEEENLWHGINTLALIQRAKKDGMETTQLPESQSLAKKIIAVVEQKEADVKILSWDYATAAEACLALSDWNEALKWTEKYTGHSGTTPFAVNGTLRQFTEVWQLNNVSDASAVLTLLNQKLNGKGEKAFESYTKPETQKTSDYESVYGDDSYKTLEWYEDGLSRCNAVARIGVEASKGIGTGFLLRGSVLSAKLGDDFVLLTNEHVINDDPQVKDTLRCEDAKVIFEKIDRKEIFGIEKIYWISERENLDVAIVQFFQKDQQRINEIGLNSEPFPVAKALPIVEKTQRVYIIGHPGGETLSLSLQDNELLDHEIPKIHYRTPTEHGSSGSPVFNRIWKLIGVHHKGNDTMPRLNGLPGTYQANEGISIQSIIMALRAAGK